MAEALPAGVLALFLLFCRIGTALMLLPGFGSARVPPTVRLLLAFAATMALAPTLMPLVLPLARAAGQAELVELVAAEVAVGLLLGAAGRALLSAFEGMLAAADALLNIANQAAPGLEGADAMPPIVSLASLLAVQLLFATDLHLDMLAGLAESFVAVPPGAPFDGGAGLEWYLARLADAFLAGLKVTAPFVVYAVVANLAMGLVNRSMPSLSIFFIAQPALVLGGVLLLMAVLGTAAAAYVDVFVAFLHFA